MNYGLPYMGSKSRICEWLMAHLPPAENFIDLFAGGCAVTHAAMISGKYNHVIANDVQGDVLELFQRAVTRGLSPEDWRPVPREEFELHKATDALIGLVWSFGNNKQNYLYGADIEEQKLAAHSMIVSETIKDRYTAFQSFCSTLENSKEIYRDLHSISRLARIQALHGLARIQALHGLARIQALLQISVGSYDACPYLPPPRHLQWFTPIRRTSALVSTPLAHSTTTVSIAGSAPFRIRSTFRSTTCRTILSRSRKLVLIRLCLQLTTTNRPSNIFFSMNASRIQASNKPCFRPSAAIR